jgi:hypothetical protein
MFSYPALSFGYSTNKKELPNNSSVAADKTNDSTSGLARA